MASSDLKIAVVCSSNMNRSMEAHAVLAKKSFDVCSFGTGAMIRIPGANKNEPNCYEFGTTYDYMYNDLKSKDKRLYTENGMLHILERNRRIKSKPEKFQESSDQFDVVLSCEEKVYDRILENFEVRPSSHERLVHVVNMDIDEYADIIDLENIEFKTIPVIIRYFIKTQKEAKLGKVDNPEDATIGAFLLCDLALKFAASEDLDDEIADILQSFETKCKRELLHTVQFY